MIRTFNRVALYARFSSDNQRSESIDAQVRAMKVYCKQHGYVIVHTYVDEAKSATTDRRPGFQQMIADSREGMQLNFFQLDDPVLSQVRDEILGIDVNNLTPLEALNKLNDIKRIVRGK